MDQSRMLASPYITNPVVRGISRLPVWSKLAFLLLNYFPKRMRRTFKARTYFGAVLRCDPRDFIQRMILNFGFWEPNISAFIARTLSEGDYFLDIGANIGYHTLLGATLVGLTGRVISIEALRTTFALLQKNILLNNCSNVRAVNLAVSDRSHVLDFYLPPAHSLGTATTDPSRGMTERIQVEAKAIDEILSLDELKNLRLIKLDIEGGEIAVLRRLLSNLNAYPERLQILAEVSGVEHESGWPEIFQAMTKAGFLAYGIENSYDESWYLQWRHVSAPKLLLELPKQQTDVVFSRQPIGVGVADQG